MRQFVSRLAFTLAVAAFAWPSLAATVVRAQVVGADGAAVEDAVVFLRPLSDQKPAVRPAQAVSVQQHDREFVPYLTVVQTGTAVRFPNQDPIRHHVYSFSQPKKFEIKLYAGDGPEPIVFDKPGLVTMGCNVHDWMLGYVFIVDTPWFGKTDPEGMVQIDAVEDGEYEARVWHPRERHEVALQRIKVAGVTAEPLHFTIDAKPLKRRYKPPLDPLKYSK
jgi:plastocyanin